MNKIRIICFVMLFTLLFSMAAPLYALEIKKPGFDPEVKSAVLMDVNTGTILFEKNANESLPMASVTKVMTLLLVFEALEENKMGFDDKLVVSEYAASMGGSQVFLEPGEEMNVNDLIKCVVVASANDAAVTLAEHIAGSEEAFVVLMNKRAEDLGLKNTHFENVTGLDDDTVNHFSSALDIAIMSKELLKHEKITDFSTIWMDTIRNGEFGLTNTNRLVRYYSGITGLKTGSTDKAGFCISASAKRDDLHLIAVIMGAESSKVRNLWATKLLDFGFANYSVYKDPKNEICELDVYGGVVDKVKIGYNDVDLLISKGAASKVTKKIEYFDHLVAPVNENDVVGTVTYELNDEIIHTENIYCLENAEKITFFDYFINALKNIL